MPWLPDNPAEAIELSTALANIFISRQVTVNIAPHLASDGLIF